MVTKDLKLTNLSPLCISPSVWIRLDADPFLFLRQIMPREIVKPTLEFDRVHSLERNVARVLLEAITLSSFCSQAYIEWWAERRRRLLSRSTNLYCLLLNPDFADSSAEVQNLLTCLQFFILYSYALTLSCLSKILMLPRWLISQTTLSSTTIIPLCQSLGRLHLHWLIL